MICFPSFLSTTTPLPLYLDIVDVLGVNDDHVLKALGLDFADHDFLQQS